MDGVLAWWEKGFLTKVAAAYPDIPLVPFGERKPHDNRIHDLYHDPRVQEILVAQGFYEDLEPIAGGAEALGQMVAAGHEVYICTAPAITNPTCVYEKYRWIQRHLGQEWLKRTIITLDKTIIDADILIDDRLEVKGAQTPTWEHVLYDQSYNRTGNKRRIITWDKWQEVF
jgi:5'-nucleotidase